MAGYDLTTEADMLKLRYSDDFIKTMAYQKNPLLALVPKDESFKKEKYIQPMNFADPQSISPTFSQAQTQAATEQQHIDRAEVPHTRMYGDVTIDDLLLEMASSGENMFYNTFVSKADGILNACSRALQKHLHGNGWGALGRVSSPAADTTMTLQTKADIMNFEKGMTLVFSSSENAAALRDSGDTLKAVSVNRNAGTMVMSGDETDIAAIADGDYIFQQGTRQDSATPERLIVTGVNGWVVPSDGTAGTLHSLDQTADSRLAGVSYDGSADTVLEALMELFDRLATQGGNPDVCFMNPRQVTNLKKELMSHGISHDSVRVKASDAEVSFSGIMFATPVGDVSIVSDRDCQVKYAKALQMNTFKLVSSGPAPRILTPDGLERLRGASSMDVEIRVGYYANLVCKAPGWNGIATLPSITSA